MKLYLPVLEPSERTVRDWIIVVLLQGSLKGIDSMNARELERAINRTCTSRRYSYSNVYQTAERLCHDGVLCKLGGHGGYSVNFDWSKQMQNLLGQIRLAEVIKKKSPIVEILQNLDNPVEFPIQAKFPCLYELETWVMRFAAYEKSSLYSQSQHLWWHIIYPQENRLMAKQILEVPGNEIIGVGGHDSDIERLCISWSEPLGQKIAINTSLANAPHYFVVGKEHLLFCTYPAPILTKMTKMFNSIHRLQDLPSAWEISTLLEEKHEAEVVIVKSAQFAETIKNEIIGKYKEAKIR